MRSLLRAPALSAAVVATLAVGIAAFTIAFGAWHAAVVRQPPFPEADRIAILHLERRPRGEPERRERWSFGRLQLLEQRQQSFEQIASFSPVEVSLSDGGDPELTRGERVAPSYFRLLRSDAARGRLFADTEDDPVRPTDVVLISHQLWTRRWAADPGLVGRTIRLNGIPFTVIGILPDGFAGLSGSAQLWVPRTVSPALTYAEYLTTNQNFISAVGRLRAGVALAAARSELAVLGAGINRGLPSDPDNPDERVTATAVPLNDSRSDAGVRQSLLVLLAGVGLLHLLACANATNLLLGRATRRRNGTAVRAALGGTPAQLFRSLLAEGVLLAAAGGAIGIALAALGSGWITPPANAWGPRNFYGSVAPFDVPAFGVAELAFGLGLTLCSALLVGLPPAMTAFRLDLATGMRTAFQSIAPGAMTWRRPTARGIVVAIEAAFAMLLVVMAGLLIESFRRMRATDIGIEPAGVLTFWVIPSEGRTPPAAAPAFVSRVLDAVTQVPGVRSASVDGGSPLSGSASTVLFMAGRPMPAPGQAPPILRHYVGPDHFMTLGIPLRQGRTFTTADVAGAPGVAVISETAARRFWPDQDPIGQRVWFGGSAFTSPDSAVEIVGIVGDVIYAPLDRNPNLASFYTPYAQFTYAARMVLVKTEGDPMSYAAAMRRAVASVDPELALREVQPLAEIMRGSWARSRFDAILFGGFGVAALLLAASGIFAVLAHAVATRTREFGIRIALGANSTHVLRQVVREGMVFPVVGVLAGVAGSLGATRVLRSSLYDISPVEPSVLLGMIVLLLAVAVVACLGPAWRSTRADPIEALRAE
jgi:putative ABC transport system permease protein